MFGIFQVKMPFPSCFKPHCQSEAWCTTFHIEINFYSHANNCAVGRVYILRKIKQKKYDILEETVKQYGLI